MFRSVLIANRGEIACRIIRTAKQLGMRTIAVYSEADAEAPHVAMADEAYRIGAASASESYLRVDRILGAARASGADCVHPGYGFLAESAAFAEACGKQNIAFVGPPPEAIRLMGLKHEAKALMAHAGVPVVPGYGGGARDPTAFAREAERIGYPVLVKPVAGGGGKGMRRVAGPQELSLALEGAQREALAAFGDSRVLLEKCLDRPRHIEVQVFSDRCGNCVHLFERDCSLQRRHQKIIEEAPAPGMTPGLRRRMAAAAQAAAHAVGYVGAGTVEFLVEGSPLSDASPFYFLEMNTRLQVEHPVTEAVTGIDLVEWQFRIAGGETLPLTQEEICLSGHAVEARLYAEDPERGFLPSPGRLYALRWPGMTGIRIDTGIAEGSSVSPHYDPMLAKLIAHDASRAQAISRLRMALEHTVVAGPRTNLAFLHALLGKEAVASGAIDTGLVDRDVAFIPPVAGREAAVSLGVPALLRHRRRTIEARRGTFSDEPGSPWSAGDGFSLGVPRRERLAVLIDGEPREVDVIWSEDGARVAGGDAADMAARIVPAGEGVIVLTGLRQTEIRFPEMATGAMVGESDGAAVRAPMHGRITKVYAAPGQYVRKGDRLAVLEAMKMEHVLHAPREGTVQELAASEGAQLEQGAVVAVIGSKEEA